MKLPGFKKLVKADYPQEFQDLVEKLSFSINDGITNAYQALTNNLNFQDNFSCIQRTLTISVDSNGIPLNPVSIALSNTTRVSGLQVFRAINQTDPSHYPTSGIHITWAQNQNNLIINHITGLYPKDQYNLTIVVFT